MEKFFRFTDEKSDKYWEAACNDLNLTIFFGKIHSAGRVEEKHLKLRKNVFRNMKSL
ncbi:MAG: hypothetical protein IPP05_19800 [Cytophagaceae bacterium]|nr:hypothetical protein [Cytophagaceae bacterium]